MLNIIDSLFAIVTIVLDAYCILMTLMSRRQTIVLNDASYDT